MSGEIKLIEKSSDSNRTFEEVKSRCMIEHLKLNSKFSRNVITIMTGTAVAQALPVFIMPILTRLWSPEEFGVFATYMAFVGILGVVATGRLDMALMLPRRRDDAIRIMMVALSLSFVFIMLVYLLILIVDYVEPLSGITIEEWHYLAPMGGLLYAGYALMIAWHNRNKHYSLMGKSRVIQSSTISFSQVVIGSMAKFNLGLMFSDLIGRFISIILIVRGSGLLQFKLKLSLVKKIALLKRYRKFPLLEAPASLVNNLAHQLPFIILPIVFSSKIAGQYYLAYRALMIPASLVGTAVLEVFKNRAQEDLQKTGSCRDIFLKTGFVLFIIGILPAVIVVLFAPSLFVFVFGAEWREAGEYAQILAPMALAQFVSSPLSYVLILKENLYIDLKFQLFFLVLVMVSIWIASKEMSATILIWLLMISGVLFYFLQVIFSYNSIDKSK